MVGGGGQGGWGEGRGHEQVTRAFHDTGVNRQKKGELQQSLTKA